MSNNPVLKAKTMKYLYVFFFFYQISFSFSQGYLGFSVNGNLSFWDWRIVSLNENIDYGPALGWRLTVLGGYKFLPMLGVRAELGTQLKANARDNPFGDGTKRELYQYLDGSLVLDVFPVKQLKSFYLLGGFSLGYLARARLDNCIGLGCESFPIDLKESFYRRDLGSLDWGLGFDFRAGAHDRVRLEGRFQHRIFGFSGDDDVVDVQVNSLLLGIGYAYRF